MDVLDLNLINDKLLYPYAKNNDLKLRWSFSQNLLFQGYFTINIIYCLLLVLFLLVIRYINKFKNLKILSQTFQLEIVIMYLKCSKIPTRTIFLIYDIVLHFKFFDRVYNF